jgi:hypothetical protein
MVRNTRIKKRRRSKYRNSKNHRNTKRRRNKKTHRGGTNCNDPNFSIYNTNMLKLFPYKGGNLDINDPYKNNEGPQV